MLSILEALLTAEMAAGLNLPALTELDLQYAAVGRRMLASEAVLCFFMLVGQVQLGSSKPEAW